MGKLKWIFPSGKNQDIGMKTRNPKRSIQCRAISRKQKRARTKNPRSDKQRALHLFLGDEHDKDREQAAKLRLYRTIPRKVQQPFPQAREVGFAGHWIGDLNPEFKIQNKEDFVAMNLDRVKNCYYFRKDNRPERKNNKPRKEQSGLLETNAALETGWSMVLADLVRRGEVSYVRNICLVAGKSGMKKLCELTGYLPEYMACHPDSEGTLSFHLGVSPVDVKNRMLIGLSATGKRGRKGLKNLGHCFISVLEHAEACELPSKILERPKKNLNERKPHDWQFMIAMNECIQEQILQRSDGMELQQAAKRYKQEAAEDWKRRFLLGTEETLIEEKHKKVSKQRQRRKLAFQRFMAKKNGRHQEELDSKDSVLKHLAQQVEEHTWAVSQLGEITQAIGHYPKDSTPAEAFLKIQANLNGRMEESKNLEKQLSPIAGETLLKAAERLSEQARREGKTQTDLATSEKKRSQIEIEYNEAKQKIITQENELVPLRKLKDAVMHLFKGLVSSKIQFPQRFEAQKRKIEKLLGLTSEKEIEPNNDLT